MLVSAYAKGLLDLIKAKSLGVGFGQCADYVQPVVDAKEFLGLNDRLIAAQGISALVAGFDYTSYPLMTVPPSEIWRIKNLSGFFTAGAGESAGNVCLIMRVPQGQNSFVMSDMTGAIAANTTKMILSPNCMDLLVEPGTSFGVYSETLVGSVSSAIEIVYERLRA